MRSLPLLFLLLTACGGRFRLDPKTPWSVSETTRSVQLTGDLSTTLVATFPEHRSGGPYPTVLLVPGFGPVDRDGTLESPLGDTPFFRRLAEVLTARGFAVVRYDERHVRGPGDVDLPSYVADRDQPTFVADLLAVQAEARRLPMVDGERLFLLGFDEGGRIAAKAAGELDLAGLVLVGTPATQFRVRLERWFDGMLPYLERFAWQGQLDGYRLAMALHANAAEPQRVTSSMLVVSAARQLDYAAPSPLVDRDRDGILNLDTDVEPAIPGLVDFAFGPLGSWVYLSEDRALPTTPELLADVREPVFVLAGEHDASVAAADAAVLGKASAESEVLVVPGVGHALGPAREPADDIGRAFRPDVLDPLVAWLVERSGP